VVVSDVLCPETRLGEGVGFDVRGFLLETTVAKLSGGGVWCDL